MCRNEVYKMGSKQKDILNSFEEKLRTLFVKYKELERENAKLKEQLDIQDKKFTILSEEKERLNADYIHLKTALTINPNRQDIKETKDRLAKLVREVDTCLDILKQ